MHMNPDFMQRIKTMSPCGPLKHLLLASLFCIPGLALAGPG